MTPTYTTAEWQALYQRSRPRVQRQMLVPTLLAAALAISLPLVIVLAAVNSPFCVPIGFAAFFSPLSLPLISRLRRAYSDPLEIYEGKLVPVPNSATAILVYTTRTSGTSAVDEVLFGMKHRSSTQSTSYWVTMDVQKAYRVEKSGEQHDFTPSTPRVTFQIFPKLYKQMGGTLHPDENAVLAAAPVRAWVFKNLTLVGQLQDFQSISG